LGETNIQITYNVPIQTSPSYTKYISIFQKFEDNNDILREKYSAQSDNCKVSDNNNTLILNVSSYVFNQPNSSYYIKLDTGFIIHKKTHKPLLGIYKDKWKFKTGILRYNILHFKNYY
jgi:hypothetical protein